MSTFAKIFLILKKYIFPLLLTLLSGFVTITATAQSWSQKFDFGITYSSLNKQSRLASVFNLLASNNNKNVNSLRQQLSFNMQFSISKNTDNEFILKYLDNNQKITGDVSFRNFKIDSLLLPEKLAVGIWIYRNGQLIDTLNRILSLRRGSIVLPLSGNISPATLSVSIKAKQPVFTQKAYDQFLNTAGLINHYYGYRELMQEMPQLQLKTSGEHPPAASFFLNYVLLKRLENYVRSHKLSQSLHLSQHDPLHFQKAFAAMLRRQTRMKTLSQQLLQSNSASGFADKEAFTRGYVSLSIKTVALSDEHQPFVAASFNEFTRLFPNNEEATFIRQIQTYYNRNNPTGQAAVSQEIYKYFIDAASLKNKQQSYVRALDFLSNAAYLEQHFPGVKRIAEFDSCLMHARDGLATSYLKVARMAAENNDNKLTKEYLLKAAESLKAYNDEIKPPANVICYSQYAREMLLMAKTNLKQDHYHRTLNLLAKAQQACHKLPVIDSLRTAVCEKLLSRRLGVSRKLLEQSHITASRDTLLQIAKDYYKLCPYSSKLTQNKEVTETATAIFQQIISKGATLHHQNQNVRAIAYLKSATKLQKTFSLPESPQLKILIAQTTVPYILSIADKANLEIWKKHFQKADSIFRLAQSLSLHYGVSGNETIKKTFDVLSLKLKASDCQWKQEKITRLFTQTYHAVKAYQLTKAKSYFLKAKQLYDGAASCQSNKNQMSSTFNTYENLFRFTEEYHQLTLQLFSKGFTTVLPGFVRLEKQYNAYHLEQFDLPFTSLYTFVRNQHSEILIMEAVHYFIRQKEFTSALRYLQLYENPIRAKTEQKQIATGFVHNGLTPDSRLLQDPAFTYFAKVWRKRKYN